VPSTWGGVTPDPPLGRSRPRTPRVLKSSPIHTRGRLLLRRFVAVFNLEGVVSLAGESSIPCGCVSPHQREAGFLPNASRISLCPEGWDSAYFPLVGGGGGTGMNHREEVVSDQRCPKGPCTPQASTNDVSGRPRASLGPWPGTIVSVCPNRDLGDVADDQRMSGRLSKVPGGRLPKVGDPPGEGASHRHPRWPAPACDVGGRFKAINVSKLELSKAEDGVAPWEGSV